MAKKIGWHVYMLECSDGTFFGGLAKYLDKSLERVGKKSHHFTHHPEKLPFKLVFIESDLNFREAYAKFRYLMSMNRRQRLLLLKKKRFNNSWTLYMYGSRSRPGMYGFTVDKP